ncbi:YcaO-like family protein [Nonomuraea ceibae]|uniref:YcaO-like family protein n=1 Tax=Nonomuraea ceibae TaxID=1935170 RepID=UPI001C5CDE6D|nr:YcaO-like family protein [Nonomuraea ceibae]
MAETRLSRRTLPFEATTRKLMRRMLNPVCGLTPRLKFSVRSRGEPRVAISGTELTGVHVLNGGPQIPAERHHLGGAGILLDEPLIKSLGESAERYCHHSYLAHHPERLRFDSYRTVSRERAMLPPEQCLTFFSGEQLDRDGFLFRRFDADTPMSWLPADSLTSDAPYWLPAQLALVGYRPRRRDGERWINSAVTTGTAAHSEPGKALLGALEELVQLDCVVGHWYGALPSVKIRLDRRLRVLDRLIEHHWTRGTPAPEFHLLPSPDLPGFTIACLYHHGNPAIAPVVAGLGSDQRLAYAMYKALLEAVAVFRYATWMTVKTAIDETGHADKTRFFDLDDNVAYYTAPANAALIEKRFAAHTVTAAADLPPDGPADPRSCARRLVDAFAATGKQLAYLDLTTPDIRHLGLTVCRVWSPDTLSLCLPSAPPLLHPRFAAYGGAVNPEPHPYP